MISVTVTASQYSFSSEYPIKVAYTFKDSSDNTTIKFPTSIEEDLLDELFLSVTGVNYIPSACVFDPETGQYIVSINPLSLDATTFDVLTSQFITTDILDSTGNIITNGYNIPAMTEGVTVSFDPYDLNIDHVEVLSGEVHTSQLFSFKIEINKAITNGVTIDKSKLTCDNANYVRCEVFGPHSFVLFFESPLTGSSEITIGAGAITVNDVSNSDPYILPITFYESEAMLQYKRDILSSAPDYTGQDVSNVLNDILDMNSVIGVLPPAVIKDIATINGVMDCARNLPQRILEKGMTMALGILGKKLNDALGAQGTVNHYKKLLNALGTVENIATKLASVVENPVGFLDEVLAAQGLTPAALNKKIAELESKFGGKYPNISDMVRNLDKYNICELDNRDQYGNIIPRRSLQPTNVAKPVKYSGPTSNVDLTNKIEHDHVMTQLRVIFAAVKEEASSYNHQDYASKIVTNSTKLYEKLRVPTNVGAVDKLILTYKEDCKREINPNWPSDLKTKYDGHINEISVLMHRSVNVIQNFTPNMTPSNGEWRHFFMSAYGNVDIDSTTASEVNSGKLNQGQDKMGNRGNKLVPLRSVASNYFTHGSILNLKYSDGELIGTVSVDDSGGMSNNVIDFYCGSDRAMYRKIQSKATNATVPGTKPRSVAKVLVQLVSGGVINGKTLPGEWV